MNEDTIKLIRDLAEKFGTTSEHLWAVMVRQALISSIGEVVSLALWLALSVWLFRWVKKKQDVDDCDKMIVLILIGVLGSCAAIMALIDFETIVAGFINPEYWALHQFIKAK